MKTTAIMKTYKAALYMRLSKDDGESESSSIGTQRKMLRSYAKKNGFEIGCECVDDGYSGTNFERPGFKQMINAIEQKEVNLVLTKDLSRLGRDYIKTGQYTELYFPSRGVRFIALGEGYDSLSSNSDLIPFCNIVNEMYARDISKKIRLSLQVRMDEGSFIGNFAPYGYGKDPADRHRLIPDPLSAPVVKRLFTETAGGRLPSNIAGSLNGEMIPSPALYRCQNNPHLKPENYTLRGLWTANTIIKILHNPVYLGHMVQGKSRKISFKSAITVPITNSERISVPNTHPPIVTEKLFNRCQEQLSKRTCKGSENP